MMPSRIPSRLLVKSDFQECPKPAAAFLTILYPNLPDGCYCRGSRHHAGIGHFGVVFYDHHMLLNDEKLLDEEEGKPNYGACR